MRRSIPLAVPALCMALLGACASPSPRHPPVYGGSHAGSSVRVAYGEVRSIEPVGIAPDQPQGAGAVAGGIIGAVIGRQFGSSSSGKNVGTVAGAIGGALIGNEIERNARRDQGALRITVQLDRGGWRSFDVRDAGGLHVGDRVRVEGNTLYAL